MKRRASHAFWVTSALPALGFLLVVGSGELRTMFLVTRQLRVTQGVVARVSCARGTFDYRFTVGDRAYVGVGRPERVTAVCARLTAGSSVPVAYAADNPRRNIASSDPSAVWRWNLSAALLIAALLVGAVAGVRRHFGRVQQATGRAPLARDGPRS